MARKVLLVLAAGVALVAAACGGGGSSGSADDTEASISTEGNTVAVALGESGPDAMYMNLNQSSAPSGKVTFVVTNEGQKEHEFVVLKADTSAGDFPVMSEEEAMAMEEGEAEEGGGMGHGHDINEDVPGIVNMGEIAEIAAGATESVTITLGPGHYALICNIRGHYATGMWADLQVS